MSYPRATTFLLAVLAFGVPTLAVAATDPAAVEGESPEMTAQRRAEQAAPRTEVAVNAALLDKYAGYYQLAPNVVLGFARDGDHLRATRNGKILPSLHAESDGKFFFKMLDAQISFNADASEAVLHQNGRERAAPRVDETQARNIQKKADSAHVFIGGSNYPGPLGARAPIN